MKKGTKLGLLSALAVGAMFNPWTVNAAGLPQAVDGKITLEEDVTLTQALVNKGTLTIDLAGHSLIRDGYYGYLINNAAKDAKLTIVDSSEKKTGSIVCEEEPNSPKSPSSCIRNNGTLTVDGIKKIKAHFIGIKNEEESTATITNTNIESVIKTASAIQNYGTLTVDSSNIKGADDPQGAAIFSLSWVDKNGEELIPYSSSAVITNSTLTAYWPVIIEEFDNKEPIEGETIDVRIEDSVLNGTGLARIQARKSRVAVEDAYKLVLAGDMTAASEAFAYLEEGSTLTLNKETTEELVVPEGVTLVVPENYTVVIAENNGNIKLLNGASVENKTGSDLVVEVGEEGKTETVHDNEGLKYTEEKGDEPSQPEDPKPEDPKPEDPTPEKPEDNKPIDNPQTLDGITVYAALAGLSIGAVGLVLKKHLD